MYRGTECGPALDESTARQAQHASRRQRMIVPMPQPPTVTVARVWPARYQGRPLQVCEDAARHHWIATEEVRALLPSLRPDVALQAWHPAGLTRLDQSGRWFFHEQALARELKRMGSRDALMLLAWLERTLINPGERWRAQAGPPPRRPTGEPSPRPTLWRGELSLRRTLFAGGGLVLILTALVVAVLVRFNDPDHYDGGFLLRQGAVAAMLLGWAAAWGWWTVGLMRCALRRQRQGGGFAGSLLAYCTAASMLLGAGGTALAMSGEWLLGLWATITFGETAAEVVHEPGRGRIVLRGPIGFGSYEALQRALLAQPRLDLLQLESPGGFLIEGLAMARLVERRHLDTLSLDECHSACTLMFTAGNRRWLGPNVEMGFHRSRTPGRDSEPRWNDYDHRVANHYRARGLAADFVQQAMDTPGQDIWLPPHARMLDAGVATGVWSAR